MYILYAGGKTELDAKSALFEQHMEPQLKLLEAFDHTGQVPQQLPEIREYLAVCRWAFRKLEYAFALEALLRHLRPGDQYLDAGSGVTPLAFALAKRGIRANACDANRREIEELVKLDTQRIYAARVDYTTQDLTATTFADETFHAISCISVLEHIPAPHDQAAIRELLRLLTPGGLLVMTVDFTPAPVGNRVNRTAYYTRRLTDLVRRGDVKEVFKGLGRKLEARQAVAQGTVRQARSANQCFEIAHLEQDIAPLFQGIEIPSGLTFSTDLHSVTPKDARHFWDMDGLGQYQDRDVLPVGFLVRKPTH